MSFVRDHGVVFAYARGPVPSLARAIAGDFRGSWWSHPKSHAIYRILSHVCESEDVLVCRLVDGKVTIVHRRLWPALVRLADRLPPDRLAQIHQEHTPQGKHRATGVRFPDWVPQATREESTRMTEEAAIAAFGYELLLHVAKPPRPRAQRPAAR